MKVVDRPVKPCPWDKKNTAHRYTNGSSIQRVAGICCQQHTVNPKRCGRTEDGTSVGRIHHTVDYHQTMCSIANTFHTWKLWTAHGTQYTSRQRVARQFSK